MPGPAIASAARLAEADDVAGHDAGGRPASDRAIDDWDELSRGDDPTDDPIDDSPDEATRGVGAHHPAADSVADAAGAAADPAHPSHDDPTGGENPTGPSR